MHKKTFLHRKVLATILISLAANACGRNSDGPTTRQWRADMEVVAANLEAIHPNAWFRYNREDWQNDYDRLSRDLPNLTEYEIFTRMRQLVTRLGDGHSDLVPDFTRTDIASYFPVRTYMFTDGLYIIAAADEYCALLGSRVLRYGKFNVDEAIELAGSVIAADNEFSRLQWTPRRLMTAYLMEALGVVDSSDSLYLEVLTSDGGTKTVIVQAIEPTLDEISHIGTGWYMFGFGLPNGDGVIAGDAPNQDVVQAYGHLENLYWHTYLAAEKTVYFQMNAVVPNNNPEHGNEPLSQQIEKLFATIDENDVEKFVIDLRFNSGGNNRLIKPLVHGIIKRDRINQTGKLFVITGRQTFSAAMSLAGMLEEHTNVLFVGEPAGSTPNQYGDARTVTLPNSGMIMRISTVWWMNTNALDRREMIAPQLPAQLLYADFAARRDPALDIIFATNEYRNLQAIFMAALDDGDIGSAKAAYQQYKRDTPNSWADTKADMNNLGYSLFGQGRFDEAIAVFELNVQSYPDYANGWDSLGEAYMASGDYTTAMLHYEKSLKLNPNNGNAADMIHKMKREIRKKM